MSSSRTPHNATEVGCDADLARPIKTALRPLLPTIHPSFIHCALLSFSFALLVTAALTTFQTPLRFVYNCFVKPFIRHGASAEQKDKLNAFYSGQADVYDSTRTHLLKGRETMLQLLAAHLKAQPQPAGSSMARPKIWVDIGGGTGWNIEQM